MIPLFRWPTTRARLYLQIHVRYLFWYFTCAMTQFSSLLYYDHCPVPRYLIGEVPITLLLNQQTKYGICRCMYVWQTIALVWNITLIVSATCRRHYILWLNFWFAACELFYSREQLQLNPVAGDSTSKVNSRGSLFAGLWLWQPPLSRVWTRAVEAPKRLIRRHLSLVCSLLSHFLQQIRAPKKVLTNLIGVVYFWKALGKSISKITIPGVKFKIVKSG